MRIAFLCKRRYMGKDVIVDRYARLYEIPHQLARLGHEVRGFCFSYQRGSEEGSWTHEVPAGSLHWESHSCGPLMLPELASYPKKLYRRLRGFAPDIVLAASDIPHVVLGGWIARRLNVPFAADLYDNFEGFGQARIPGMVGALRRAVRCADVVTTTSAQLKEHVVEGYGATGTIMAMPSTIDKAVFRPRDKMDCRRALGLPLDASLVGTAGGLSQDKGVETFYSAWRSLAAARPEVHLVLAGPLDDACPPPQDPRVHYLGMLAHADTANLFGALDVGAICIRDSVFGRYSFPQKAYEMIACELPVVAARIGAMADLLSDTPQGLYPPDNPEAMAGCLLAQLDSPRISRAPIRDWTEVVTAMEVHLRLKVEAQTRTRS